MCVGGGGCRCEGCGGRYELQGGELQAGGGTGCGWVGGEGGGGGTSCRGEGSGGEGGELQAGGIANGCERARRGRARAYVPTFQPPSTSSSEPTHLPTTLQVSFLTPAELFSPTYGACLARHMCEHRKHNLKHTGLTFSVYEVGGGNGTLARDVLVRVWPEEGAGVRVCLWGGTRCGCAAPAWPAGCTSCIV